MFSELKNIYISIQAKYMQSFSNLFLYLGNNKHLSLGKHEFFVDISQ